MFRTLRKNVFQPKKLVVRNITNEDTLLLFQACVMIHLLHKFIK
jgi:hypothetical protein